MVTAKLGEQVVLGILKKLQGAKEGEGRGSECKWLAFLDSYLNVFNFAYESMEATHG